MPHFREAESMKRLLVAEEVSEIIQEPTPRVYQLAREGRIGGVVRIGRHVRFDPAGLREWIAAGGCALPVEQGN